VQCFKVSFEREDRTEITKRVRKYSVALATASLIWLDIVICGLVFIYPFLLFSNFIFLFSVSFIGLFSFILCNLIKKKGNVGILLTFTWIALVVGGLTIWGVWSIIHGESKYALELLADFSNSLSEPDLSAFYVLRHGITVKYFDQTISAVLLLTISFLTIISAIFSVNAINSVLLDKKAQRFNANISRQHLIPFNDRISGVSFASFFDKEPITFNVNYDNVELIETYNMELSSRKAYDLDTVRNLVIKCTDNTVISLLVDEPEKAKETIEEAKRYYFPTPQRRVCNNCGWFMVGARCPHCKGEEYTVYTEND